MTTAADLGYTLEAMESDRLPARRLLLRAALFALPGVALAAGGLSHPHTLTGETAAYWWRLHVALIPVFPLLGLALAALVGRRRDVLAWAVRVLAYVYALGYTALDMLSGVATGYTVDPAVTVGDGPAPLALKRLYGIGNDLGTIGAQAFLIASVLVAIDAVRRIGVRAAPPGLVLVVASVSFLDSHIYPWRGVVTVLAIGLATGWLCWLRAPAERPQEALSS